MNSTLRAKFRWKSVLPSLWLLPAVALFTGCATRGPFTYQFSTAATAAEDAQTLGIQPTVDGRGQRDEMLDKVVALPEAVDTVLVKELASSGLFSKVVLVTNGCPDVPPMLMALEIRRLDWLIPDHGKMATTGFLVGLTTGIVGASIYGSTRTDIESNAEFHATVKESGSGRVLLNKDYEGKASERPTKFKCDTPGTGRRISADALKQVVDQLKSDLRTALP
jgi:hypothetical protein